MGAAGHSNSEPSSGSTTMGSCNKREGPKKAPSFWSTKAEGAYPVVCPAPSPDQAGSALAELQGHFLLRKWLGS